MTKKLELPRKQREVYSEGMRRGLYIGNRLGLKGIRVNKPEDEDAQSNVDV